MSLTTRPPLILLSTIALDYAAAVVSVLDLVPGLEEIGLDLGKYDQAVLVLHLLEEHVEGVAVLYLGAICEFRDGDSPLTLESDVEDDFLFADGIDRALDDLALFEFLYLAAVARPPWQASLPR